MNEPNRESTPANATLLRRLFSPRQWPKYLFAFTCLVTLAVLFVTVTNRRSVEAQLNPNAAASPERAAAEKLVPPPVPDDQNFAATPYFASLFDKSTRSESDRRWPDDFSRADQWPRRFPVLAESAEGRKTGRFVSDLLAWKMVFEKSQNVLNRSDTQGEIVVSDAPDSATNAQAAVFILEALKPYEPVLDELQAARRRPHARFDIRYDWDNPWGILLPHLAVMKRTVQLLRLKATAELAAGHSEQGLQDVLLMLRIVDSNKDEPTLISQLVRIAALEISFNPVWEGLAQHRWSEAQLASLQAALQQVNLLPDLHRVLEAERTWANLTIALVRDRRTPGFFSSMMEGGTKAEAWVKEADKAFLKCPREWFDAEQQNCNRLYDERILKGYDVNARRVHPRMVEENAHLLEKALRDKNSLVKEHLVFAKALLIAPSKVHLKLAGTQGYCDLAVVACALERHRLATGRFPESLATLVPRFLKAVPHDLVSGQPLHYERTNDGQFLLYAVGWNETDDNGELAFLASGRSPEKKEGDWVWRYPTARKTVSFE